LPAANRSERRRLAWSDWRVDRVSRLKPIRIPRRAGPRPMVNRRRLRQHRGPAQYRNCAVRSKAGEPAAPTDFTAFRLPIWTGQPPKSALAAIAVDAVIQSSLVNRILPSAFCTLQCLRPARAALHAALGCLAAAVAVPPMPSAQAASAIAMHGAPAPPDDFTAAPYVNPDAPKGGRLTEGVLGTFDSLNPLIVQGLAVQTIRGYVIESLMARGYDEPFTLYGLVAQSIETDDARTFVTFTLNPAAHFSDGVPV